MRAKMRTQRLIVLAATAAVWMGCTETLPPPQTPAQALPPEVVQEAFATRPAEGEGVVARQDIGHGLAEHGAEDEAARGATIAGVLQALADAAAR